MQRVKGIALARAKIPRVKGIDKRVKLTGQERIEIKELYGTVSQGQLAKKYGVSKRLIAFIGNPDKLAANKAVSKASGGSKRYYSTEYNRAAARRHKEHKTKLWHREELIM